MALPLWGELEKAQDDATTIAAYVAAQIAAHNEDADSHLESGASLEAHKTESVIDHPAGSVLADKLTFAEDVIQDYFSSLDGWGLSSDPAPSVSGFVASLVSPVSFSAACSMDTVPEAMLATDFFTREWLVQIQARVTTAPTDGFLQWGVNSIASDRYWGYSLDFRDDEVDFIQDVEYAQVDIDTVVVDTTVRHVYRMHYDPVGDVVNLYIDGVIVASQVNQITTADEGLGLVGKAFRDTDTQVAFNLSALLFSASLD